jgi:hypothetical protein
MPHLELITSDLVSRFRSSHHYAARSLANFGIKGTLAIYDSSAVFGFEVPTQTRGYNDRNFKSTALVDSRGSRRLPVFEAQGRTIGDLPPDQTFGRLASDILPGYLMERRWYAAIDAGAIFLDAYAQAVQGCPSFPAALAQASDLLRLFVIEKALYEIGYELANRPDWVDIPIAGVLAIVDGVDAIGFSARPVNDSSPLCHNARNADRA